MAHYAVEYGITRHPLAFLFCSFSLFFSDIKCGSTTEEEKELIHRKMAQAGTDNFSAYARKMLIDGYIIQVDYTNIKEMTAEIQKIGVNINQIARRVNTMGTVYDADIQELKERLTEIWHIQRSILSNQP